MNASTSTERTASGVVRLGFVGVGWIGRHRMEALEKSEVVQVAALADPDRQQVDAALEIAPRARVHESLEALLTDDGLDGVIIATPNALHAEQCIRSLDAGKAVFCQKPLGRTADETHRIVDHARRRNLLLGVDLSYRHLEGMRLVRRALEAGELGHVFAVDLTFHNAYGPGKAWPYDPSQSGGGCLIDLGVHLVDLVLWTLGHPRVERVASRLFADGRPFHETEAQVEDYAVAQLDLEGGCVVRLACSWDLHAGKDAVIEATFQGTGGAFRLQNVDGSYYDFRTERLQGRTQEVVAGPPDDWSGRAVRAWAEQLASGWRYHPDIESVVDVAATLDRIYGRGDQQQARRSS